MGTPELIVIGIIILLFYGPDRLPGLLAKINRFFRDIRNATTDVRSQINREINKIEMNVNTLEEDPHHQSQEETLETSEPEQEEIYHKPDSTT